MKFISGDEKTLYYLNSPFPANSKSKLYMSDETTVYFSLLISSSFSFNPHLVRLGSVITRTIEVKTKMNFFTDII